VSNPYNPKFFSYEKILSLGSSRFARRYSGNIANLLTRHTNYTCAELRICGCFIFLRLLECFTSAGLLFVFHKVIEVYSTGFPHSEISGSQVATHLPEAYRRYATSFFAFSCLGIHRSPLIASLHKCSEAVPLFLMRIKRAGRSQC
jgi:hypothetical protein